MDKESAVIRPVQRKINEKLVLLPLQFRETPLSDWCGRNNAGSYEHRFKASSQKRSALFSLTENLATHVTINTNLLGKSEEMKTSIYFSKRFFCLVKTSLLEFSNL